MSLFRPLKGSRTLSLHLTTKSSQYIHFSHIHNFTLKLLLFAQSISFLSDKLYMQNQFHFSSRLLMIILMTVFVHFVIMPIFISPHHQRETYQINITVNPSGTSENNISAENPEELARLFMIYLMNLLTCT